MKAKNGLSAGLAVQLRGAGSFWRRRVLRRIDRSLVTHEKRFDSLWISSVLRLLSGLRRCHDRPKNRCVTNIRTAKCNRSAWRAAKKHKLTIILTEIKHICQKNLTFLGHYRSILVSGLSIAATKRRYTLSLCLGSPRKSILSVRGVAQTMQ